MIYYNDDNDPINKVHVKIESDAYVDKIPTFIRQNPDAYVTKLAAIHRALIMNQHDIKVEDVFYTKITQAYLPELVLLHREWFPVQYDKDYFKKFLVGSNHVALGAFVKINGYDYLVGCVFGEFCKENRFRKNVRNVLPEKRFFGIFSPEERCGYINTLGVIDEFRRLKIGSKLLTKCVEEMRKKECVALFLHVIEHNKSAIKFYEKNGWLRGGFSEKYYLINDKYYDALIFYTILVDNLGYKAVDIGGHIASVRDSIIARKGCCQSLCKKICCLCRKKDAGYENV